jgi:diadenosine tetraphosphate (Ap4A) HIT family hydrolase
VFEELMRATRAVVAAFAPWKMNHLSLGNTDEHVHWHLMPRYEDDPQHHSQPFVHADRFDAMKLDDPHAAAVAASIRSHCD